MASSSAREEFLMRSQTYMTDALSRCACGNFAKPGSKFCNACTRALNSETAVEKRNAAQVWPLTPSSTEMVEKMAKMEMVVGIRDDARAGAPAGHAVDPANLDIFELQFGCSREEFDAMPAWKQRQLLNIAQSSPAGGRSDAGGPAESLPLGSPARDKASNHVAAPTLGTVIDASNADGSGSSSTMSSIESWNWREQHELPCWGQSSGPERDLASIGLDAVLTFPTLVTPELTCRTCGKRDKVQMVRHHPGGCSAFESVHGVDIDWRWLCCGEHESFHHGRPCSPSGSHPTTGCVVAPICIQCFKCPCLDCIARFKWQQGDC